jgi:hypothetical protein
LHYGYLDIKPKYWAKGSAQGEIHIKVTIGAFDKVWLCGESKGHVEHIKVMLDENVYFRAFYSPKKERKRILEDQLKWRFECKEVSGLPQGTHVLSVSTDEFSPDKPSSLTHVITWPDL